MEEMEIIENKQSKSKAYIYSIGIIISAFTSLLPALLILGVLIVILIYFHCLECLILIGPFIVVILIFCYYILKEIFQKIYYSIELKEDGFLLKKFLNKETIHIFYKDIESIQFVWNNSLRFILGYGGSGYGNLNYNNTSFQSDRNEGGKDLVIKLKNKRTIAIYEYQFDNSKMLFDEIIEKCKLVKTQR